MNFKERKYAAGYKQKVIWVPRNERKSAKKLKSEFLENLEKITAGWDAKKLKKLFDGLMKTVIQQQKEAKKER